MVVKQRDTVGLDVTKKKKIAGNQEKSIRDEEILSVCENIVCPNQSICLNQGLSVFHIMGSYCSRTCTFCSGINSQPIPLDPDEPVNVANAVKRLRSRHVVLTSFSRDDLPNGGVDHIASAINAVHAINPGTSVEVIMHKCPTNKKAIKTILDSSPEIITHNVMTVPRISPQLFDNTDYACSIDFLETVRTMKSDVVVKSGLLLGLGENNYEVIRVMSDLYDAGCNCLTIGQHLPRSKKQIQPSRYVAPWEFFEYGHLSMQMGYSSVRSGPFTCSSFDALNMYREIAE